MSRSLEEWLTLIESFHPAEIDLGLARISKLADSLDLESFDCPVITVAGTNGKGSCVETIKQLALAYGKQVASYTSPHLFKFNERIQVNGEPVSDECLVEAFEQINQSRLEYPEPVQLSFFEFTTLAAFQIFKNKSLDLIVLEVGLGGRLDAVNLVNPDISVITSIGIDHESWLGNTREQIAREKLGIARKGKILVVGEQNLTPAIERLVNETGAKSVLINSDFSNDELEDKTTFTWLLPSLWREFHGERISVSLKHSDMHLAAVNLLTAVQAFLFLGWEPNPEAIKSACIAASLPGRFQCFELDNHRIILDLTHNPAGAEFLCRQLQLFLEEHRKTSVTILCGVMKDKDFGGIVNALKPVAESWIICKLETERSAEATDLESGLNEEGLESVRACDSIEQGIRLFRDTAEPGEVLVILGSFFAVAPALAYLQKAGAESVVS